MLVFLAAAWLTFRSTIRGGPWETRLSALMYVSLYCSVLFPPLLMRSILVPHGVSSFQILLFITEYPFRLPIYSVFYITAIRQLLHAQHVLLGSHPQ